MRIHLEAISLGPAHSGILHLAHQLRELGPASLDQGGLKSRNEYPGIIT